MQQNLFTQNFSSTTDYPVVGKLVEEHVKLHKTSASCNFLTVRSAARQTDEPIHPDRIGSADARWIHVTGARRLSNWA